MMKITANASECSASVGGSSYKVSFVSAEIINYRPCVFIALYITIQHAV